MSVKGATESRTDYRDFRQEEFRDSRKVPSTAVGKGTSYPTFSAPLRAHQSSQPSNLESV